MKFRLFMSVLLISLITKAIAEENESFYQQLCHAVLRLEYVELAKDKGRPVIRYIANGTAFFVTSGEELFIVSARHVVERPRDLQARVECRIQQTNQYEVVLLELPRDKWTYHNNIGDNDTRYVDVAVMKVERNIPWIKGGSLKAFRYEPKESKEQDENQLPYEDPSPPQPILVFGFPADIGFSLLEQRPLGRMGIVSMKTEEEFLKWENKFGEERCCLIDVRIFEGNSGSPVMNQTVDDPKSKLLGLVIAVNQKFDFAIIEPMSRIRETLDLARTNNAFGKWKPIQGSPAEQKNSSDKK